MKITLVLTGRSQLKKNEFTPQSLLEVLYDFVIKDIFRSPDLRYYVGVGLTTLFASEFKFGLAGEVGLEYGFPRTPITIGLDYRPAVIVLEKMDFVYENFGLNVRYRFK